MSRWRKASWAALALILAAVLAWTGCSSSPPGSATPPQESTEETGTGAPTRDPSQPFAVSEKGTVTLTNGQAYDIVVQREDRTPLFDFSLKKGAIVDPSVQFTIQTPEVDVPEELASSYVQVGSYAFEMHVAGETGYGFALRPTLTIYYADAEIEAARQAGASLDTLKGNLIVLYKEQRAPKWVPQTSVSLDQEAKTVTVTNVAGAGAWRLAARKAP